ncbi:DUF1761 domain-containing protein [Saccharospirillum mangrovi]|uniref:DUF1761 domain-containing protein n=1 Tax=Saccharospirillum mangrovi TaxID=2161747 RepID=UPI000D380D5F|nr:DUF1761 domain-containing protein [Saccharospirillum mangrovi]
MISTLNVWAVLAAFVPYFVLGALWFTVFFSRPYRRSLGRDERTPTPNAPIFIVGPMLCMAVITVTTAVLMQWLAIESPLAAFAFAILVGLGYLVTNTLNIAINPNIPKPVLYAFITGSYHLIGVTLACFILLALG